MILLSRDDLWVNVSVLDRIGNPDAADASDPDTVQVKDAIFDDLPADCGQWLGMEVPEQLAETANTGYLLKAHGALLTPGLLLFDLQYAVPYTFDELFGNMEYAIMPPKGQLTSLR